MSKMPALAILALYLPLIYISVKRVRLSKSQIYLLSGSLIYCALLTVLWYLNIKNINGNIIYYGAKNIDQGRQLSFIFAHLLKAMKTFFESIINFPYFEFQLGYSDLLKMMHVPITISFFSIFCMFTSFRIQEKDSIVIEKSYRMIYNLFSKLVFLGILLLIFICRSQKWGLMQLIVFKDCISFLILLIPFSNGKSQLDEKSARQILYLSLLPSIYYVLIMFYQLRT